MKFDRYIKVAREYSKENHGDEQFKHVSMILYNKQLVSIGHNCAVKTHPMNHRNKYRSIYIHSETHAFSKLSKSFIVNDVHLVLLNLRFYADYTLGESSPCQYCWGWCHTLFDRIYASNWNGIIHRLL